ncbi:hypothetical protein MMC27_007156 [Xylographa pallens]|nr:hypothetical protein [Xylographa pallens]
MPAFNHKNPFRVSFSSEWDGMLEPIASSAVSARRFSSNGLKEDLSVPKKSLKEITTRAGDISLNHFAIPTEIRPRERRNHEATGGPGIDSDLEDGFLPRLSKIPSATETQSGRRLLQSKIPSN